MTPQWEQAPEAPKLMKNAPVPKSGTGAKLIGFLHKAEALTAGESR